MEKKELKGKYAEIVDEYLKLFCYKHGLNYKEAKCGWVTKKVGDVVCVNDYYISFDDIRLDIDEDVDKDEYEKYYDYCVEAAEYGCTVPNYRSWLDGCPRLSIRQLNAIREAKDKADEARKLFMKLVDEEENKIGYRTSNPF